MKHVMFADKSLLIGDQTADLLLRYGALLARLSSGDGVSVRAIGADGDEVVAGLLLNSGTSMVIETSTSTLPEPDNREAEEYMRSRIEGYDVQTFELGRDHEAEEGRRWEA